MKKVAILFFALLALTIQGEARKQFIAPYYQQSDFLATSAGVAGDASGGFFNPAVWGMMSRTEMQFFWNDLKTKDGNPQNWAASFGGNGFGFSAQQWSYPTLLDPTKDNKLTDYNIGIGFGDKEYSFGLGYGWSNGRMETGFERDQTLSFGFLGRPIRYLSFGYAGHATIHGEDMVRSVVDLGVRPFGTSLITLFGDATMMSDQNFGDVLWAAGAEIEPMLGIKINGKFMQGGTYMTGISISFGMDVLSVSSHYDKGNSQTFNTYGVRAGFTKPNIVMPLVMQDKNYLALKFDHRIKYQRYKFFDNDGYTLMELLDLLERAKNDPTISGLSIKITERMTGSIELVWEVREKIKEFQATGKKVVVWFERGGMTQYYLASVADKIMVEPETVVMLQGYNMGRTFYKDMLDKIGIGVDEWRFFEYKSAFESFSRTSMSEADKQQRYELVEGFYNTYRADICESRGITPEQFDHIVNNVVMLSADSLLAYNLVDTTGRKDDIEGWLTQVAGKKKETIGKKQFMMLQADAEEWGVTPQIAVIYALGPCSMDDGINARRLEGVIKRARDNKHIKAVVFRADSPGGDILPSDIVAVELKKTAEKKPVIVSQGRVAGSGGYWISMYGDKIVASPWTITGSIGVIGGWIYNDGLGEKIGLTYDHTQMGEHADLGDGIILPLIGANIPNRNVTIQERANIEKSIRLWYKQFVERVAEGRGMEFDAVHEVAQGRVWTGTAGLEIGLVDELGGMEKAIDMAFEAADLKRNRPYKLIEMPGKGKFDVSMFAPKLFGVENPFGGKFVETDEMRYYRMMLNANSRPWTMLPPELHDDYRKSIDD